MKIDGMGERNLIKNIMDIFPDIINDDSFYFDNGSNYILITTDITNNVKHYPENADPEKMGYFFVSLNLSDIAAMGGIPDYFLSSFSMSRDIEYEFFEEFLLGMKKCLNKYNVKMAGGDTKEGIGFTASGMVVGHVEKDRIMLRRNFRPGMYVGITNDLGKNASGYYMWINGEEEGANILIDIEPRIEESRRLSELGVKAAMDLSDGIYSSIYQLKNITGTGFRIYFDKIPRNPLVKYVNENYGVDEKELLLNFGGEYEILFGIEKDRWDFVYKKMDEYGYKISIIGETYNGENVLVENGSEIKIDGRGYEHFA
jgi:thiamine-monophosphate kinase